MSHKITDPKHPKYKINCNFILSNYGINYIKNEEKNFNYRQKNAELIQKMNGLINNLDKIDLENKDEIIAQIKLKKKQNEEYGNNYVNEVNKFFLYYNTYNNILYEGCNKLHYFFFKRKNFIKNEALFDMNDDIQYKIAGMFYDFSHNYENLLNLYKQDTQIIDDLYKKYGLNFNK